MTEATAMGRPVDNRRLLEVLGSRIEILVTSEETNGNFAIIEFAVPPDFPGAPAHYHERMTEVFYMLEGEIELLVDGLTSVLRTGEFAMVPPGCVHGYRNPFAARARFLVTAPGHDRFFFELIEWMRREPVWPPADRGQLVSFGLRHDTYYK